MDVEDISDSDGCEVVEKRYFGLATRPQISRNPNPFDDREDRSDILHLCTCAREGCGKKESLSIITVEKKPTFEDLLAKRSPGTETKTVFNRFPRCKTCLTKYCSRECQILDHKEGPHKEKCRKFTIVREYCEKTLCKRCWEDKWAVLSDFYPEGKPTAREYSPCRRCFMREMGLEDNIPSDITSDPDIQRVWFQ